MKINKPNILILYFDDGSKETIFNTKVANDIYNALLSREYKAILFKVDESNWQETLKMPGEIVFNFVEDRLYEIYKKIEKNLKNSNKIQFGSIDPKLNNNKKRLKKILLQNNIPVPKYITIDSEDYKIDNLKYPLIIKPSKCHSSVGINQNSVVTNENQLKKRIKTMIKTFPQIIVEEFIFGREINATVLGNGKNIFTLPYAEIIFNGDCNKWKIYSYEAKWAVLAGIDSCESGRDIICPTTIPKKLKQKIDKIVLNAYQVLGFKDIARIDFKLTDKGEMYIFDANSNPSISDTNCYDAEAVGWNYEDYMEILVHICNLRYHGKISPTADSLYGFNFSN